MPSLAAAQPAASPAVAPPPSFPRPFVPPAFWTDALCRRPDPRCHDLLMETRQRVQSEMPHVPVPYCPPAAPDLDERDRLDFLRVARWLRFWAPTQWPRASTDQVTAALIGNVMPCDEPPPDKP